MGGGVWRLNGRGSDIDISGSEDFGAGAARVFSGLVHEREGGWINTAGHLD